MEEAKDVPAQPEPTKKRKIPQTGSERLAFLEEHLGERPRIAQTLLTENKPARNSLEIRVNELDISTPSGVSNTLDLAVLKWKRPAHLRLRSGDTESEELYLIVRKIWCIYEACRDLKTLAKDVVMATRSVRVYAYLSVDMGEWTYAEEALKTLLRRIEEFGREDGHDLWLGLCLRMELSWFLGCRQRYTEQMLMLRSILESEIFLQLENTALKERVLYRLAHCEAMQGNYKGALEVMLKVKNDTKHKETRRWSSTLVCEYRLRRYLAHNLSPADLDKHFNLILPRAVVIGGIGSGTSMLTHDEKLKFIVDTETTEVPPLDSTMHLVKACMLIGNIADAHRVLFRIIRPEAPDKLSVEALIVLCESYYQLDRIDQCLEMARTADIAISDFPASNSNLQHEFLLESRLVILQWYQRAKWRITDMLDLNQPFQSSKDPREPLDPLMCMRLFKECAVPTTSEYYWLTMDGSLRFFNDEQEMRRMGHVLPIVAGDSGPLVFTCTKPRTRAELFPGWVLDLFSREFENRHREVKNFMSWAMRRPPYFSWHYTNRAIKRGIHTTFIPTAQQVEWASSSGSLSTFHCHEYPVINISKFERTWAKSYSGQHISTFKSSSYICTVSILQAIPLLKTEREDDSELGPSPSEFKVVLRTTRCLTTYLLPTFCYTTVQLLNNHYKQLIFKWRLAMSESNTILRMMNIEVLSLRGGNDDVILKILQFAQDLTDMEGMLDSQLQDIQKLRLNLNATSTLLDEVNIWEAKNKIPQGYLLRELDKIEEELRRIHHVISRDLNKKMESLIQKEFNLVSIHEAQTSVKLGVSMQRLSWITFIFLPLIFVSSLFGMNVDILQTEGQEPAWWWYLVFSLVATGLVSIGWVAFKYLDVELPRPGLLRFWDRRRQPLVHSRPRIGWPFQNDIERSDLDVPRFISAANRNETEKTDGTWETETAVQSEQTARRRL